MLFFCFKALAESGHSIISDLTIASQSYSLEFLHIFIEEDPQLMGQFGSDVVLLSLLDCLQENFIFYKCSADTPQHIGVDPAVIVDRHEHEDSSADSLEGGVSEMIITAGGAADKDSLGYGIRPAVEQTESQFREDLGIETFAFGHSKDHF